MTDRGAALTGWDLLLPLTLTGVGLGLLVVPLIDIALANVPLRDAGAASGTYGTFQQIGAAVGVAVAGTVFFTQVGTDFSQPNVMAALTAASGIAIGGYLLSARREPAAAQARRRAAPPGGGRAAGRGGGGRARARRAVG